MILKIYLVEKPQNHVISLIVSESYIKYLILYMRSALVRMHSHVAEFQVLLQ